MGGLNLQKIASLAYFFNILHQINYKLLNFLKINVFLKKVCRFCI
jgi:hypothetical protein